MRNRIKIQVVVGIPILARLAFFRDNEWRLENVDERGFISIKQFGPERVEEVDQQGANIETIWVHVVRNVNGTITEILTLGFLTHDETQAVHDISQRLVRDNRLEVFAVDVEYLTTQSQASMDFRITHRAHTRNSGFTFCQKELALGAVFSISVH
ncbi:hypothetical protein D3C86_1733010 [compost metagenome]